MALEELTKKQRKEFQSTGRIQSASYVMKGTTDVLGFPENPFDYAKLLERGAIGEVPEDAYDTPVAIIGAGAAGLCAAYELMKVGLRPIVYEASGRIGGRTFSKPVPSDPGTVLELGAMRVPLSHETFAFYKKSFGLQTQDFPNPGAVDTMLCFGDKQDLWSAGTAPPPWVASVGEKLLDFFKPKVADMAVTDPVERVRRWRFWVERYKNLGFLDALFLDSRWSSEELAIVGALGGGTGGLDAQFRVSFLELLRAAIGGWADDEMVLGGQFGAGTQALTETFWQQVVPTPLGPRSVRSLQKKGGSRRDPRPGVVAIRTTANRKGVEIEDATGRSRVYKAAILTCTTRAAQLGIDIDPNLFGTNVWRGLRRIHYMNASKVMCSTPTRFWKKAKVPPVTLTDRSTRSTYLMEYGPGTTAGSCLLGYTWGDDSTKLMALPPQKLLERCVKVLDEIHGGAFGKQTFEDVEVIHWQEEAGYHGAFKLCYPGQYEDNMALFNQYKQTLADGSKDGLFLAGEGVSWAGGWIEGALHSGLNAAFSTLDILGGDIG